MGWLLPTRSRDTRIPWLRPRPASPLGGTLKIELGADGVIVLRAPAQAATTVRRIPGARHDAKRQVWLLPLSWATCVTARGIVGADLEVGPRLAEWARAEQANRIAPALDLRGSRELPAGSPWLAVLDEVEA